MSNNEEAETTNRQLFTDATSEKKAVDTLENDLLAKKLESFESTALQTEAQFYNGLYKIFSKLLTHINTHRSKTLNNIDDAEIMDFLFQYEGITADYEQTRPYAAVWNLAGQLFAPDTTDYASALIQWVEEFNMLPEIDESHVWRAAQHNLIRGYFDDAIMLLEGNLESSLPENRPHISSFIELIKQFEEIRQDVSDEALYKETWTNWRQNCQYHKETYAASVTAEGTQPESRDILKLYCVLTGDVSDSSAFSFFEKVIGSLLYARPLTGLAGLTNLARDFAPDTYDKSAETMCSQLIRGCYEDALDAMNDAPWLQTHIAHILIVLGYYHKNEESLTKLNNGEEILSAAYYAINSYATLIADGYDMWNEAIAYLSVCQENSEIWVIELLDTPALPKKTIQDLKIVLDTAVKFNMPNVQKHIHWSLGKRFEEKHAIRDATIEYGKAHDLKSIDRIAHGRFNDYLKHGTLDHVVTDMEELKECPHYAVLIQYRLFKQHLEHKQWKEASRDLLLLLKNQKLPEKFEIVLLIDNLKILEESEHYYLSDQMLVLLEIFKQISDESANGHFISAYYKSVQHVELPAFVIIAKLRESLAYKAATAPK